ncbi:Ureidoglycolate lyase [Corynebacterium occultum]|uniref:Ureidoglycolate lyase n=1 Tax=Corynebacterium occultum TaxID=2675219 RepID=A0A6B8WB90_9CORY|nr:fumarylacetoacetate hydrolase family protein [Corynebacterium occultum]QGU08106.1 Ureidoglycolate lyase [Corynebacterium occultum]
MNYISFRNAAGSDTWGISVDGTVHDLGPSGLNLAASLKAAIEEGIFGKVSDAQLREAPTLAEAEVEFLPAVTDPLKILCIGVNYRTHQEETGKGLDMKAPTVFTRFADSQIGHLQPAQKSASTTQFDYEGELAVVISRPAHRLNVDEAMDHVAGYGIYNDFSCRDWQLEGAQWIPGKNFPGTGAFGPYLVPLADIEDFQSMTLETRVNGEVRQHAVMSDLYFTVPELIAYITGFTRLNPGDVIITGTPGGVGLFMEPPALLSDGDQVEVEISGLGILRNTVKDVA